MYSFIKVPFITAFYKFAFRKTLDIFEGKTLHRPSVNSHIETNSACSSISINAKL